METPWVLGLAGSLGLPILPPFPDLVTARSMIFGGVSYVSCASGIPDKSGQHYIYTFFRCASWAHGFSKSGFGPRTIVICDQRVVNCMICRRILRAPEKDLLAQCFRADFPHVQLSRVREFRRHTRINRHL